MFLHRDYFMSSPWRVLVFDDRVELISPGSLPNHLTVEMMKSGVSVARNPLIFTFATKEIPYRGIGSGVKRVMEIAPKVEFVSDGDTNYFTAKIFRQKEDGSNRPVKGLVKSVVGSADAPVNLADAPVNSVNAPVNLADAPVNLADAPVNLADAPVNSADAPVNSADAPVNSRAEPVSDAEVAKIKKLIRSNPGISKKDIASSFGIAVWTVKRILERHLRDKVEFRGAPKNGGYYLKEQK
jgi:predicted HTH transcriptional regulator